MPNINLKNIDKSNWKSYRFDQIAINVSERVDPKTTNMELYIGLEHLDSDSIHIKRSGTPDDVEGQKLKCYPGDVIFGKRRAYQRKAAVVTEEGICSAHAFVLRANPEIIEPKLFPFFLHSYMFMHRAVDISVGGLSPTINWSNLREQEFLLPPKDQQAQIAELLWAMDDVIEKDLILKSKYEKYFKRYMNDAILGKLRKENSGWKEYVFGELGETFSGLSGKKGDDFGFGLPFVNYMNVFRNSKVNLNQVDYVKIEDGENQHELKYGDILITGSSETPDELGMSSVVLDDVKGYYLNSFCFGFRLHTFNLLLPEYTRYLMRSQVVRDFMKKHAQGYTRFNLSKKTLKTKLKIVVPIISEQKFIAHKLERMDDLLLNISNKISASKALQKSLINQVF